MNLFHIKKEGRPKKLGLNILEKTKRTPFGFDITIPIWFLYKVRYQDWRTYDVMEGNVFYCLSLYLRKRGKTIPGKTWIFKARTGWRKSGKYKVIYATSQEWLDEFGYPVDFACLRKL